MYDLIFFGFMAYKPLLVIIAKYSLYIYIRYIGFC